MSAATVRLAAEHLAGKSLPGRASGFSVLRTRSPAAARPQGPAMRAAKPARTGLVLESPPVSMKPG